MSAKQVYPKIEKLETVLRNFKAKLNIGDTKRIGDSYSIIHDIVVEDFDPLIKGAPRYGSMLKPKYEKLLQDFSIFESDPPRKSLSRKVGGGWQAGEEITKNLDSILRN